MSMEIILTVTSYDKEKNNCQAVDQFSRTFEFDPFVGCALTMTDDQYLDGFGFSFVGNRYCATNYSFSSGMIIPHEGGLHLIGVAK